MKERETGYPLPPYDLLYGSIDLVKEIGDSGIKLLMPRVFLHGRQSKEEYENRKRKQVEITLQKEGIQFLLRNPVIVCAIPDNNQLIMAIMDGHHRARYAGLYGIATIPCLICTPTTMVRILNEKTANKMDEDSLVRRIKEDIGTALQSFYQPQPRYALPQPVYGISNIQQLKDKYRSF